MVTSQNVSVVSVIIPCYNGERFLAETIESVLAQTYKHFEIVVVDDGSVDQTHKVAASYPRVKYFYQKNQGVCRARNRGVKESCGEYLVFLDQDDRLLPHALETGVSQLRNNPQCSGAMGCYRLIDTQGNLLHKTLTENRHAISTLDYPTMLRGYSAGPPAGAIFRREPFETIGGFDPQSPQDASDLDLYLRIVRESPLYCYNQTVYEYRRHPGNCSLDAMLMTRHCLATLERQRSYVETRPEFEAAYSLGKQYWRTYFYPMVPSTVVAYLRQKQLLRALRVFWFGLKHSPQSFVVYTAQKIGFKWAT